MSLNPFHTFYDEVGPAPDVPAPPPSHPYPVQPPVHPAFAVISREAFREGIEIALEERQVRGVARWHYRRHLRNSRLFEKLYQQAVPEVPYGVYGEGFDFEALVKWLTDNLPTILQLLASLLVFI